MLIKYLKKISAKRRELVLAISVLVMITTLSTNPSFGQEAMFKATFENNSLDADVGKSFAQTDSHGILKVVPNPAPDSTNSSSYVLESSLLESSKGRAEYSNSTSIRYPTEGETHIYTWKRFYPKDMFKDLNLIWLLVSQWKTWPCEKNGEHGQYICPGGAIFNDVDFKSCDTEKFRFRALPDCNNIYVDAVEGVWEEYTMIIYWSNDQDGYYHLFKNRKLVGGETGVKTIYDNFPEDHSCDIYFTLGLYSGWSSPVKDTISFYIDDFAVYKANNKSELQNICPECSSQIATSTNDYGLEEDIFEVYPNPCKSYVNVLLKNNSEVSIYNTLGALVYQKELQQGETRINLNFNSGTFLIKVTDCNSNNTSTKKIII